MYEFSALFSHMPENIQHGLSFKMRQITRGRCFLAEIAHKAALFEHNAHRIRNITEFFQAVIYFFEFPFSFTSEIYIPSIFRIALIEHFAIPEKKLL